MGKVITEFKIYTDGACSGNPGKGAYCYIILNNNNVIKKHSGGFIRTTNNRMELISIIESIKYLNENYTNFKVSIFSDSKYVTDAFNQNWITEWIKKDFKKVKNTDLWKEYLSISNNIDIKYTWIKGHNGIKYNEECDKSALEYIKNGFLDEDRGYIN